MFYENAAFAAFLYKQQLFASPTGKQSGHP